MAAALFTYTLPTLQLVCHLVTTGNSSIGTTTLSTTELPSTPSARTFESGTTAPPSSTTVRALPPGYVVYPDFGVAYKIFNESVSWDEARNRCVQEGADLATIDSFAKVELLMNQKWSTVKRDCAHAGFYLKDGDASTWYSVSTGLPVSNLPWRSGEPYGNGRCTRICILWSGSGLVQFSCEHLRPFVCQISYP